MRWRPGRPSASSTLMNGDGAGLILAREAALSSATPALIARAGPAGFRSCVAEVVASEALL